MCFLLYFKLVYLRLIAKQVITTYINPSRPLIADGIHIIFERGLSGEKSQTYPYILSAKQGIIWYYFHNVFRMTRSGIEPMTSRLRGERSNHRCDEGWGSTSVISIFFIEMSGTFFKHNNHYQTCLS